MLAMNLSYTLANYCCCVEGTEKEHAINRISEMAKWWKPAEKIVAEIIENGNYQYAHKPKKAK